LRMWRMGLDEEPRRPPPEMEAGFALFSPVWPGSRSQFPPTGVTFAHRLRVRPRAPSERPIRPLISWVRPDGLAASGLALAARDLVARGQHAVLGRASQPSPCPLRELAGRGFSTLAVQTTRVSPTWIRADPPRA
jgi:hypothetical protein